MKNRIRFVVLMKSGSEILRQLILIQIPPEFTLCFKYVNANENIKIMIKYDNFNKHT